MKAILPLRQHAFFCVLVILFTHLFSLRSISQGSFTDQSGNTYKTIRIGSRIWMAENLRTDRFANGDKIDFLAKPSWYISETAYVSLNNGQYLYTWEAVKDSRGIAPEGWHVATPADWQDLIAQCRSSQDLRSTSGWSTVSSGGYYSRQRCSNCINWNDEYKRKVACHVCRDNRWVNGKYIPVSYTSLNGTDRYQFNIKQLGHLHKGDYSGLSESFWTPVLDTRPEHCGSVCGNAFVFDLGLFSVTYQKHHEYMLPVRLVKNDNNYNDVPRNRSVQGSGSNGRSLPNETDLGNTGNIIRDNSVRKDVANVFYKMKYTLFDLLTDEPIFPDNNGIYTIYYATNEDKTPRSMSVSGRQLEGMLVYKFKNYTNCANWCTKK